MIQLPDTTDSAPTAGDPGGASAGPRWRFAVPVLGLAAYSGSGKTGLLERVIPRLVAAGLRLGLIKLSHHDFEIDVPGKDSYRLRKAGARRTLLASPHRWALIEETPEQRGDPDFAALIERLSPSDLDLVLVEGGRRLPIAKLEVHRPSLGHALLCAGDPHIIALASDSAPPQVPPNVLVLDLNNDSQVADFIITFVRENSLQR